MQLNIFMVYPYTYDFIKLYSMIYIPDNIGVFSVDALRFLPPSEHDGGVYVGRR